MKGLDLILCNRSFFHKFLFDLFSHLFFSFLCIFYILPYFYLIVRIFYLLPCFIYLLSCIFYLLPSLPCLDHILPCFFLTYYLFVPCPVCYRKGFGLKGYGFGQGGPALLSADVTDRYID